jgi:hypothetical protein
VLRHYNKKMLASVVKAVHMSALSTANATGSGGLPFEQVLAHHGLSFHDDGDFGPDGNLCREDNEEPKLLELHKFFIKLPHQFRAFERCVSQK